MKNIFVFAILLVCFMACKQHNTDNEQQIVDTIPQLITQVKKCSRLYTAEVKMHKIITHKDTKNLKGTFLNRTFNVELPVGERKIAIPLDATVKAYVDLSNISSDNIVRNNNKIELILPDPQLVLTSTKIDHNNIKELVPLMRGRFTDEELTNYENQGRETILKAIPNLDIINLAQESATKTLVPIFKQLGFQEKNITISFRKNLNANKLSVTIN